MRANLPLHDDFMRRSGSTVKRDDISAATERELRNSCAVIIRNLKSSEKVFQELSTKSQQTTRVGDAGRPTTRSEFKPAGDTPRTEGHRKHSSLILPLNEVREVSSDDIRPSTALPMEQSRVYTKEEKYDSGVDVASIPSIERKASVVSTTMDVNEIVEDSDLPLRRSQTMKTEAKNTTLTVGTSADGHLLTPSRTAPALSTLSPRSPKIPDAEGNRLSMIFMGDAPPPSAVSRTFSRSTTYSQRSEPRSPMWQEQSNKGLAEDAEPSEVNTHDHVAQPRSSSRSRTTERPAIASRRPSSQRSTTRSTTASPQLGRKRSKTEMVKHGVMEYIRPSANASRESLLLPDAVTTGTTPSENGNGSHNWWTGHSIRRRFSRASLASAHTGDETPGPVDATSKTLPPLPSLDTYKERPKHISTLMNLSINTRSSSGPGHTEAKSVKRSRSSKKVQSKEDALQREQELQLLVLEKMHTGSIVNSPSSPVDRLNRQKSLRATTKTPPSNRRHSTARTQTPIPPPTALPPVPPIPESRPRRQQPEPLNQKPSLMRRLSKISLGNFRNRNKEHNKSPYVAVVEVAGA